MLTQFNWKNHSLVCCSSEVDSRWGLKQKYGFGQKRVTAFPSDLKAANDDIEGGCQSQATHWFILSGIGKSRINHTFNYLVVCERFKQSDLESDDWAKVARSVGSNPTHQTRLQELGFKSKVYFFDKFIIFINKR